MDFLNLVGTAKITDWLITASAVFTAYYVRNLKRDIQHEWEKNLSDQLSALEHKFKDMVMDIIERQLLHNNRAGDDRMKNLEHSLDSFKKEHESQVKMVAAANENIHKQLEIMKDQNELFSQTIAIQETVFNKFIEDMSSKKTTNKKSPLRRG